jgi:hypothetical protein
MSSDDIIRQYERGRNQQAISLLSHVLGKR